MKSSPWDSVFCLWSGRATPLRMESAMPLYGHEIDATITPWEADLTGLLNWKR
jgi:glycine cleavage system aminomethyltransferase T